MEQLTTVSWETLPLIILTIATAVVGVARLVRVITFDTFPPADWWRRKWVSWTDGTGWQFLFTCWWCLSFWVVLVCVGWWIAGVYIVWLGWAWWIFWGSLALAYLAPMVITRDGDD